MWCRADEFEAYIGRDTQLDHHGIECMNVRIIVHVGIQSVVEIRENKYKFRHVEFCKFVDSPRDHTMVAKCVLTLCFVASYVLTKFFLEPVKAF